MNTRLHRTLLTSCLLGVFVAFGAACGPDTNGNNGTSSLSPSEAQERSAELFGSSLCEAYYQCPAEQDPQSVLFASRFKTEEACKQNILEAFGGFSDDTLQRDVDAGLIEWDAEKAAECFNDFEDQLSDPCSDFFSSEMEEPESCQQAVTGTQPNGEACDSDDHCQSGYCDFSAEVPDDACYFGLCAEEPQPTLVGAGEECGTGDAECDPAQNLTCDYSDDGQTFVCVERGSRAEDGACSSVSVCESGLACVQDVCTSVPLGAQGDACDLETTFCQPGLICKVNAITQAGLEASCETPLARDAECYLDLSCEYGLQCEGADFASQTPGTCTDPKPQGSDCESDLDCEQGLVCGQNDTCEAQEEEPYCEVPQNMGS